jgi:glutamyl/glutaminyl-tRNA synthetase
VPTHHNLYDAFGWQPPTFGHVGLLTDLKGQKLSKRNFDLDISAFRNMGVLPDALSNFVALLGWSHTQKKDTMDLQELAKNVCSPVLMRLIRVLMNSTSSFLRNLPRETQKYHLTSSGSFKGSMRKGSSPLLRPLMMFSL